jgi:hypothetical protein
MDVFMTKVLDYIDFDKIKGENFQNLDWTNISN